MSGFTVALVLVLALAGSLLGTLLWHALFKHDFDLIESVRRIDVRPGDTFVLSTDHYLSMHQVDTIRRQWEERLPGVHAIVLTGGIRATHVRLDSRDQSRKEETIDEWG